MGNWLKDRQAAALFSRAIGSYRKEIDKAPEKYSVAEYAKKVLDFFDPVADLVFPVIDVVNYAVTDPAIRAKRKANNMLMGRRREYTNLPRFDYVSDNHTISIRHPYEEKGVLHGNLCLWKNTEPTLVLNVLSNSPLRKFYEVFSQGVFVSGEIGLLYFDGKGNPVASPVFHRFDFKTRRFLDKALPMVADFYRDYLDPEESAVLIYYDMSKPGSVCQSNEPVSISELSDSEGSKIKLPESNIIIVSPKGDVDLAGLDTVQ